MATRFSAGWWSAELPPDWHGEIGENGVGFEHNPPLGWLQVTAAHKRTAITDEDLKQFMGERVSAAAPLQTVSYDGFSAEHEDEESFWREWWLRRGTMMIYATYNVPKEQKNDSELAQAEQIVSSLRVEATMPPPGSERVRSRRLPHRGSGRHFPK